jgi:NAD(P)-dependent dehydrogenase (short-subunit alcohol dehydrogenase family)
MTFTYNAAQDCLNNKNILITGASDGIGRAVAAEFCARGANVIALGRSQEKLEALFDEIEATYPGRLIIHPLDLSAATSAEYATLASALGEQFGTLDGLIHNAALLGSRSPIEYYPDNDWDNLMQVNVTAPFKLTKALVPALTRSSDARVIFTSSSVGRVGRAYWGAYGISKFALEGLMQTFAEEVGNISEISVMSFNPGGTRTAMRRNAYPAEDPITQPTPDSLLPLYLYLMSSGAKKHHGQALDARGFEG